MLLNRKYHGRADKGKAALQSFANSGGTNHLVDPEGSEMTSDDEGLSETEVLPQESEPWKTDNNCQRWIVIDGIKTGTLSQFVSAVIHTDMYLAEMETQYHVSPLLKVEFTPPQND